MSFPNVPNVQPSISLTTAQTIPLLLASIAFEELALAHIVNAEAEKLQLVLGTLTPSAIKFTPNVVTISDLLNVDTGVEKILRDVIKKEMLLEFKFENVLDLIKTLPTCTPTTASFSNNASITNIDLSNTSPYPSTIDVSGLQGSIAKVTVTINGFTDPGGGAASPPLPPNANHMMFLVVSPDGTPVLVFAHAGDNGFTGSITITFDDTSSNLLPVAGGGTLSSGTFKPAAFDNHNLDAPAPQTAPYPTTLSTFIGKSPNGTWSIFAFDEFGGHGASVEGGWSLTITTTCP